MSEWFWKKLNSFAGLAASMVLFGLIVFAANIEIKDMDLWLHLAAGRHILTNFSIPQVDIFSNTMAGTPWINHEWLFQVIVHSAYQWGGPDGLITLRVIVVGLTFALLLLWGWSHHRQLVPTFVLLLMLLVYQMRLTLRPDVFSLLFFSLYVIILTSSINKKRGLICLFFIQILWCNMHGFFILGPLLILVGWIGESIKRHIPLPYEWNHIGRLNDEEYRYIKKSLAVVLFACLFNPNFVHGLLYPFSVLISLPGESHIFFEHIQELHKPITWGTWLSMKHFPLKLLIVFSFSSFLFNRKKMDISTLIFWAIFLFLALNAVRNIVFFAVAAYLVIVSNTQLPRFIKKWSPQCQYFISIALKACLIIWMIHHIGNITPRGYFDFTKFERKSEFGGISLRNFPTKAVDFLVDNNIKGNFLNNFNSGAYLLGRTSPHIKVYIDGRTELYGSDFFKHYGKVWGGDTELLENDIKKYHLTGALLSSVFNPVPSKTIRYFYEHPDWILVYFDYDAAIFLKNTPENQPWTQKYALNLSQWATPKLDLLKLGPRNIPSYQYIKRAEAFFNLKFFDKAETEGLEALRIEPYNTASHKILGKIYLKTKKYVQAYENLRTAKLLAPHKMETRYHLARALFQLNQFDKAEEQCQKVLIHNPRNTKGLFLLSLIYAKQHKYAIATTTLERIHTLNPEKNLSEMIQEVAPESSTLLEELQQRQ